MNLGSFWVHKFILGHTGAGLIMLLVPVLTCGFGGIVMGTIGLIEGLLYLSKSEEERAATVRQRPDRSLTLAARWDVIH